MALSEFRSVCMQWKMDNFEIDGYGGQLSENDLVTLAMQKIDDSIRDGLEREYHERGGDEDFAKRANAMRARVQKTIDELVCLYLHGADEVLEPLDEKA